MRPENNPMNEMTIQAYRQQALLLHLTDEELEAQVEGGLSGLASRRASAHLERCLLCQGRLEFLRSMITADVIAFPLRPSRLREALNDAAFDMDPVLAKAAHTTTRKHFKDAGGWFDCHIYERDDGTMSVSIASRVTEETGSLVDLFCDQAPDWQRTARFELEGEEIIARVVLTLDDRRQLPPGCQLRCRLRQSDGEP